MALFDSDEDVRRKEGFVKRLIWPSVENSDATQLGRQGLVLCLIVALLTFVIGIWSGHPVVGSMALIFYGLGALGVRQHSVTAAGFVAFISIGNALTPFLNLNTVSISTFVGLVMPALLLANLRVTNVARESALNMNHLDSVNGTTSSGMNARVSHSLWPVARYFFIAAFAVGAYRLIGRAVVSYDHGQQQQSIPTNNRPSEQEHSGSLKQAQPPQTIAVPLAQIQARSFS